VLQRPKGAARNQQRPSSPQPFPRDAGPGDQLAVEIESNGTLKWPCPPTCSLYRFPTNGTATLARLLIGTAMCLHLPRRICEHQRPADVRGMALLAASRRDPRSWIENRACAGAEFRAENSASTGLYSPFAWTKRRAAEGFARPIYQQLSVLNGSVRAEARSTAGQGRSKLIKARSLSLASRCTGSRQSRSPWASDFQAFSTDAIIARDAPAGMTPLTDASL